MSLPIWNQAIFDVQNFGNNMKEVKAYESVGMFFFFLKFG